MYHSGSLYMSTDLKYLGVFYGLLTYVFLFKDLKKLSKIKEFSP